LVADAAWAPVNDDTLLTQSGTIMGSCSLICRNGKEAAS
jgi:hypothetical protein